MGLPLPLRGMPKFKGDRPLPPNPTFRVLSYSHFGDWYLVRWAVTVEGGPPRRKMPFFFEGVYGRAEGETLYKEVSPGNFNEVLSAWEGIPMERSQAPLRFDGDRSRMKNPRDRFRKGGENVWTRSSAKRGFGQTGISSCTLRRLKDPANQIILEA